MRSSMAAGNWTPRRMRSRYNPKNGAVDQTKGKAFRRAALWSKQFIHQSADALVKGKVVGPYKDWCVAADKGTIRRSGK